MDRHIPTPEELEQTKQANTWGKTRPITINQFIDAVLDLESRAISEMQSASQDNADANKTINFALDAVAAERLAETLCRIRGNA